MSSPKWIPLLLIVSSGAAFYAHASTKPHVQELTCGREIAADSEVPEKLAKLMSHVATNMVAHAKWVASNAEGKREHDALVAVAQRYSDIADAATRASAAMKAMEAIPAVAHDPSARDVGGQARWMREKIRMQIDFAQMLMQHAEKSKMVLANMDAEKSKR